MRLTQERNDHLPAGADFELAVGHREIVDRSMPDLLVAAAAMKHTVSNNIVLAAGGRTMAIAAGQQSRILATRLACAKAARYRRMQTESVVDGVGVDRGKLTDRVARAATRSETVAEHHDDASPVVMSSDGFIPFADNIEEAARFGVELICEPAGAARSDAVEAAAQRCGMTLVRTRERYFYH